MVHTNTIAKPAKAKNPTMLLTTMELINYIASSEFFLVVICGNDDCRPMEAIKELSTRNPGNKYKVKIADESEEVLFVF